MLHSVCQVFAVKCQKQRHPIKRLWRRAIQRTVPFPTDGNQLVERFSVRRNVQEQVLAAKLLQFQNQAVDTH